MIDFFFQSKKRVFVHFRTETLRTKLEPVHFRSGIQSRVFFSGKKKVNHYENESIHQYGGACIHACTFMYVHTAQTCILRCICIQIHTNMHGHEGAYLYLCTCMHAYINACISTKVHSGMYTHMHTYIHKKTVLTYSVYTHVHAYIHVHTYMQIYTCRQTIIY